MKRTSQCRGRPGLPPPVPPPPRPRPPPGCLTAPYRAGESNTATLEATVKIRYNHPGTRATLTPLPGGAVRVKLHTPQRAITAGQAAVFYEDDLVLGGGWITRG